MGDNSAWGSSGQKKLKLTNRAKDTEKFKQGLYWKQEYVANTEETKVDENNVNESMYMLGNLWLTKLWASDGWP